LGLFTALASLFSVPLIGTSSRPLVRLEINALEQLIPRLLFLRLLLLAFFVSLAWIGLSGAVVAFWTPGETVLGLLARPMHLSGKSKAPSLARAELLLGVLPAVGLGELVPALVVLEAQLQGAVVLGSPVLPLLQLDELAVGLALLLVFGLGGGVGAWLIALAGWQGSPGKRSLVLLGPGLVDLGPYGRLGSWSASSCLVASSWFLVFCAFPNVHSLRATSRCHCRVE